jgi:hypothetical protein
MSTFYLKAVKLAQGSTVEGQNSIRTFVTLQSNPHLKVLLAYHQQGTYNDVIVHYYNIIVLVKPIFLLEKNLIIVPRLSIP